MLPTVADWAYVCVHVQVDLAEEAGAVVGSDYDEPTLGSLPPTVMPLPQQDYAALDALGLPPTAPAPFGSV